MNKDKSPMEMAL